MRLGGRFGWRRLNRWKAQILGTRLVQLLGAMKELAFGDEELGLVKLAPPVQLGQALQVICQPHRHPLLYLQR